MQKNNFLFILLASALALIFAYTAEYGFNLHPCPLCIYQRIPYALLVATTILALWSSPKATTFFTIAILLLLLSEISLAAYHTAIEYNIIAPSSGCTQTLSSTKDYSLEDLKTQLLETAIVPCDKPTYILPGISMTIANLFYALLISLFFVLRIKNKESHEQQ